MVATEASPKELMARLGHSSTQAAMIYQHAIIDRDEAIASGWAGSCTRCAPTAAARPAETSELWRVARLSPARLDQDTSMTRYKRGEAD